MFARSSHSLIRHLFPFTKVSIRCEFRRRESVGKLIGDLERVFIIIALLSFKTPKQNLRHNCACVVTPQLLSVIGHSSSAQFIYAIVSKIYDRLRYVTSHHVTPMGGPISFVLIVCVPFCDHFISLYLRTQCFHFNESWNRHNGAPAEYRFRNRKWH